MDRDKSLWASWAIEALSPSSSSSSQAEGSTSAETEASRPLAKVWFGGDTGYKSVPRGCDRQGEEKLPVCPVSWRFALEPLFCPSLSGWVS